MVERIALAEWESWKEMCTKIQEIFDITSDEFNSRKDIRELVAIIEKWGYYSFKLRIHNDNAEKNGLFWNGEDSQ